MSILNYFKRSESSENLPDPKGPLSKYVPPAAIASANSEIIQMQKKQKQNSGRRGKYNSYTAEERAVIGKFATENGVMAPKDDFQDN